uniref:Uncharacterized protein n=1 Tax=Anopheles atroparvus TaxID=41427 RepID=A0AAG5DHW5_ANOAO
MSEEDFIYSAITDDNVNAFDLSVIANTLASTDKLVRQNKQQQEENGRLREKISSLRESAMQIKSLYEAELAKTGRIEAQLATYVSQCQELEQRCAEAENERVNTDLVLKERIAEYDRQIETNEARYRGIVCDLVRYHATDQQSGTGDSAVKWKDLKVHAGTAERLGLPEEVKAFFHHSHPPGHASWRSKRKKRPVMCDQQCQTTEGRSAARMRNSGTNTDEPYPVQRVDPPVEKKKFCDKGTMHRTMSTITRSTCTSAFIKRVDVGVNFPEVIHKSVDEILRECTRLPPLLLSPIMEMELRPQIAPSRQSVETQTDSSQSPEPGSPSLVVIAEKPQLVTCGTMTSLKNIRKRIDYRKAEGAGGAGVGVASFQQQYISIAEQLYAKKIKKEEQMASPPVGPFGSDDTFGRMHPHLSTIWTLLGETIFSLMGSPGRRFDGQCYSMINEQLATIRDMIEADGRRESELMSAMFSNVSATVEAAAGYGKGRSSGFPMRIPRVPPEQDRPPSSQPPATFLPSSDDCRAPVESFVQVQRPIVQDQFHGEKERFPAVQNDTVIPSSLPSPPFDLSFPAQTKETEEVAVVTSTTTSTIISPQVEKPVNTDVQIANETEANVARSKDTVDGIGAIPRDSTAVMMLDRTEPTTSSANIINSESVLMDEENDRIAQELRLMEEGDGGDRLIAPAPGGFSGDSQNAGLASIEDILAGTKTASPATGLVPKGLTVERIDIGPRLLAENCTPPDQRPSTPPNQLEPSSTGTFVSPIKVKETNDLVKDQFKTPTQPPISKRKLRIRRSGDSPPAFSPKRQRLSETNVPPPVDQAENAGRLSPTTEFLLEDDWDQKFSSIKAALFGHAIEGTCRPLSPIADRIESDEEEVKVDEEPQRSLPPREISALEQKAAEGVASAERQDGCPQVDKDPFAIVPAFDRIENSESTGGSGEDKSIVEKIDELAMEVDSVSEESHLPVGSTAAENALVRECSADPGATVTSESRVEETGTPQETGSSDSKQEEKEAKKPIHEPMEAEQTPCVVKSVVDVKEEGEIVDNAEKEQENAKASEAVVVVAVDHLESPESPGGWDSPMSPPAHETGASISTSESVYSLDSPLSPPPASPCDITSCAPPKLIPLDHVNLHRCQQRTRGPIDLAIECYKLERRFEVVNTHVGRLNAQEQRSMQQLAQALQRYVKSPWTDASVAEALVQVLAISQDGRVIARAVLQTVVSHGDIAVNLENTPPAPPIPVTQQKLVLLVRHLGPRLTSEPFDRVIMRELDRRVFQLKSEATVSLPGLIALTFLYIGLEDSKPPTLKPWHRTYSVRLYLFKCLYYFGFKCLPLVYYVLRAFPFALPKKGSPHYDNADAMINTIRTILMNINYSEGGITGGSESGLYKKRELFALLTYNYGYQPGSPTYEELVVNLVEKIRANRLRNVPHALVLVAKRKSYDWARQHIIQKRLYPLLNDYLKLLDLMSSGAPGGGGVGGSLVASMPSASGCDGAGLDERIVACIYTISSIMKTHPANEDVSGVMQIFTTIVQLARGNQAIQEEAIAGLVKFSRFGHADIFERISHWQPTYPVSDRIKLMLATLVHRKDLRFWQQLIQNKIV